MTMEALKARVARIVEEDWKGKAERLLEDRKSTGKGEVSVLLFLHSANDLID
jgi:hypothetical protein